MTWYPERKKKKKKTYVVWRPVHNIRCGNLEPQSHVGQSRRDHDDPHDLDGRKGKHGQAALVLEGQADQQGAGLRDVAGQDVQDELLDVVKHAAALLDGVEDAGKVVVGEDDVGGLLGDVRAALAHGDADVCALEGRRVVDAVARHGHEAVAAVQRLDHAHLCLRGAARDHQGQPRQPVDVVVAELVKVARCHDHGLGHVG